jgi:hypothetical protein
MLRNRSYLVLAILGLLLLMACGPTRPTEFVDPLPTASPTLVRALQGVIYELAQGAAAPIEGGQVEYQVRRENKTVKQGELLSDAQGRFALDVSLQKGDTLVLRAVAPGFSPAELYLTAEQTSAGAALDIGLSAPTQSVLSMEGFQWQPAGTESLQEPGTPDGGGVARLYFVNAGILPVSIDRLALDGVDIAKQIAARRVQWSRLWPPSLAPGEMGVWEVKLAQSPKEASFSLYPRDASPVHTQAALSASWLSIRYLTFSEDREQLLVYVRNEHPTSLARLELISLNGAQVQTEIKQRDLGPGEVGLLALTPEVYPALGELVCVQVQGRVSTGERVIAWASARLFEPFFPIGVWPDARELNRANQDDLRAHGLNTLILDLPEQRDDPAWAQLQNKNDFGLIGAPRAALDRAQLTAFADSPVLMGWLIADQPETAKKDSADLSANSMIYRQSSKLPIFLNLSAYRSLTQYAPIGDVIGVSHFAIDAPAANSTGSHALEEVLTYTLAARDAAAPNPLWAWAQGMCSSDWQKDAKACWNRLPTLSELRAQLYLHLIAGAKGVFWANYRAAYVAAAPGQWSEIGQQDRVLQALSSLLLYGEPAGTVSAHKGRVQGSVIVSPQAAVVPLVNLDYTWERRVWEAGKAAPAASPAFAFHPQEKPSFTVLLPEWIEPGVAFLVTPSGTTDIKWSAEGRLVTFTLDRLVDVAMVVIGGNDLRAKLDAQLKR